MSELTTADLQRIARETFGRELSEARAHALRGRLPTMARAVRLLEDAEGALGETTPVTVYRAPEAPERRRAGR